MNTTVDIKEVKKFSQISDEWWDESGKFRLLHQINPVRLSYFKQAIIDHFNIYNVHGACLSGLSIIDVGCGGGLLSEPLAKLGAKVTAIDAAAENIKVALNNSKQDINYLCASVEEVVGLGEQYDCVMAIEIIEHVADVGQFITSCKQLLKPGGILIISTLNRTIKSYIKAIIAGEYLLRWLPTGTHDWQKFLKPSQLSHYLRENGMKITQLQGLNYNIISRQWYISDEIDTNYIVICQFI